MPDLAIIPHDLDHKQILAEYLAGSGSSNMVRWLNETGEGIKIEDVRALVYELSFGMGGADQHTFVLLHAEHASIPAQNALLKTLEEPPPGIHLILTTSAPMSLLPTILSRCQTLTDLSPVVEHARSESDAAAQELWQTITAARSYSDVISGTESLKERETAVATLRSLVLLLYNAHLRTAKLPIGQPTIGQITGCLQECHRCITQLEQNAHVRLALENCFFAMFDQLRG